MRFPLFQRLLLVLVLFALALAITELVVMRWRLFGAETTALAAPVAEAGNVLPEALATRFLSRGDWSFLPSAEPARQHWFRDQWKSLAPTAPDSAAYGVSLHDRDGHYLAGQTLSRLLIAFASIDTRRTPVVAAGNTVAYLVAPVARGPDEALALAFLIDQQDNLARVLVLTLILTLTLAVMLAAQLRRPLRRLQGAAREIRGGNYQTRIDLKRHDELGDLADTLNALAARLDEAERMRRQWVADTSHELRTPLAVLHGQIEALQEGIRPASPENLALLQRHVQGLGRLVDELYQLARSDLGTLDYQWQDCAPYALLEECADGLAQKFAASGLAYHQASLAEPALVSGDPRRLAQVFFNVLENSRRYTDAGGEIRVRGVVSGGMLHIDIVDSAPGVPDAALSRLGERFYRVESSRSREHGGSGLGLPLVAAIVTAHGGTLEFAHAELGGLRVRISLPLKEGT